MMQDFTDTKKVLIVNRLRKPTTDIGKFSALAVQSYGQTNPKFYYRAVMQTQDNLQDQSTVSVMDRAYQKH